MNENYIPDLVQILPELHLARIRTQLHQISAQKHLSVQNLRTILVGYLIERAFEGGTACGESAGGDVVLEKFLVDDVDDGRDKSLDVFCASDESFDIA
jgi:hypothetical protein